MPGPTHSWVSSPKSRRPWFRKAHFCLGVLFLAHPTFSLVSAEPSSPSTRSSLPSLSSPHTHPNESPTIKSRLFRRAGLWIPPEGATPYEPESVSQKAPPSLTHLDPAPSNVGDLSLLGFTSKAKTSGKSGTLGSVPNPNIVSVPLQDLMADTVCLVSLLSGVSHVYTLT
ncbi:hypothetical protein MVEG_07796 [Podila verticillata NRRL 6337]|nr:hypothetical protein MVEG_07796 [Podila verticillata NRRL 6337]